MNRIPVIFFGALLMIGGAASGCRTSSPSARFNVSVMVDPALALDAVHVVAVAAGKSPLEEDFVPAANLQWTILVPNPGTSLTAAFVATGFSGATTLVTYSATATVYTSKTVSVILRLDSACASVTCSDPAQTCVQGACVVQPMFGASVDGGASIDGAAADGAAAVDAPAGGTGGATIVGTGGMGGGPVDAGTPDSSVDMPPVPMCGTGMHICPGGCVADNDIRTCGTSCTPCQEPADGTATCDGMSCGGTCPTGKQLCLGSCIDTGAACTGTCPAEQHACSGLCPAVTDIKACGTSCFPCPVPIGATQATCNGTTCDFQCTTGTHKCGTKCAVDSDVASCGASCSICPTDSNGTAQCVGGVCGIACASGYHICGGRCVSNLALTSCGTSSCSECTAPTGGSVACDGTMCVRGCPAGQRLCAGICIDTATACSGGCPAGTHDCSGVCAPNGNTDSCGTMSCQSCAKPTGADITTCDGTACDFTCGAGYHRCGTRCAADNDATGCGASCTNCPTDPNGTPACVTGVCGLICNSGFHVCNQKCVDNKAVATCGPTDNTSCSACTAPSGGGTVSCDGLACAPACPLGSKLCIGACIASALACNGMCPSGTHSCSGICQLDSTSFCGPGCNACNAPPSNGSAVCSGTPATCGISCAPGYKNCAGTTQCVATAGCCGDAECTKPPSANMTGACLSASCSYSCAANYRLCGSTCITKTGSCCSSAECAAPQTCGSNNVCVCISTPTSTTCSGKCGSVVDNCGVTVTCPGCGAGQMCGSDNKCASCGAVGQSCCSGSTCTGTGNACVGGSCQCAAIYHACGTTCASNTSASSCGTSCTACAIMPNATATCAGSTPRCGLTCNDGFMVCTVSGACVADHWDFEDASSDTTKIFHGFVGNNNVQPSYSGSVVHGGSFSLALSSNLTTGESILYTQTFLTDNEGLTGDCPASTDLVNREGKTLSGWIHLDSPPAQSTVRIYDYNPNGQLLVVTIPAVAGWSHFSAVTNGIGNAYGHYASMVVPPGATFTGTVYLDDFSWK